MFVQIALILWHQIIVQKDDLFKLVFDRMTDSATLWRQSTAIFCFNSLNRILIWVRRSRMLEIGNYLRAEQTDQQQQSATTTTSLSMIFE